MWVNCEIFFTIGRVFYRVGHWDDLQIDLHFSLHDGFEIQFVGIVPVFLEFNGRSQRCASHPFRNLVTSSSNRGKMATEDFLVRFISWFYCFSQSSCYPRINRKSIKGVNMGKKTSLAFESFLTSAMVLLNILHRHYESKFIFFFVTSCH